MDILNWLYLRKEQLIRKTANNADTDLIAVGADVTFAKRDDRYKTYAMPIKDLSVAGDVANTGFYELQLNVTNVVTVTTQKGIIDITKINDVTFPDEAFGSAEVMYINNPELDLTVTNRENIYIQYSVYYSPASADNAIPYVLATGAAPTGLEFSIFNASPLAPGGEQWEGAFYLYYELYTI
jgi:hypothetical protein